VPGCPGGGGPPTPDRRADLRADPNGSRATPRARPGRRVGPRAHHSVPSSARRRSLSVLPEIEAVGVNDSGRVDLNMADAVIHYVFAEPHGQPRRR